MGIYNKNHILEQPARKCSEHDRWIMKCSDETLQLIADTISFTLQYVESGEIADTIADSFSEEDIEYMRKLYINIVEFHLNKEKFTNLDDNYNSINKIDYSWQKPHLQEWHKHTGDTAP